MLNKKNFTSKKVVEFSSLALTPKEGIPAFLIKFQDCDSKLRLLGFLELTGALGEVLRDGKFQNQGKAFLYHHKLSR
jgi:hypothetical protein